MSEDELHRVQLLMAKALADSRERQNRHLSKCFDIAIEIANFWRDQAPAGTAYPPELAAKIEALAATD